MMENVLKVKRNWGREVYIFPGQCPSHMQGEGHKHNAILDRAFVNTADPPRM